VEKRDEEHFQKLDQLNQRGSDAWNQMREEVLAEIDAEDCRLSKATPSQMVQVLSDEREIAAILLTMPWKGIRDFDDLTGLSLNISYSDDMSLEEVEAVIMQAAGEIMKRKGMGIVSLESLEALNQGMESLGKEINE
jgi:hypothetical protein